MASPSALHTNRRTFELDGRTVGVQIDRHRETVTVTRHIGDLSESISWPRCSRDDCDGYRLDGYNICFAHADPVLRLEYIEHCIGQNVPVCLNGIVVNREVLDYLATSTIFSQDRLPCSISIQYADIDTPVDWSGYHFRSLIMSGSIFRRKFSLHNCHFAERLDLRSAYFDRGAPSFNSCIFHSDVNMSDIRSTSVVLWFTNCHFHRPLETFRYCGDFALRECTLTLGLRSYCASGLTSAAIVLMANFGIQEGEPAYSGYAQASLLTLKSLIPGMRDQAPLTPIGEYTRLALSIAGPALLALGLLAVRGRVKR